jgi:hypothetical protein
MSVGTSPGHAGGPWPLSKRRVIEARWGPNRWHPRVNCNHGDSTPGRLAHLGRRAGRLAALRAPYRGPRLVCVSVEVGVSGGGCQLSRVSTVGRQDQSAYPACVRRPLRAVGHRQRVGLGVRRLPIQHHLACFSETLLHDQKTEDEINRNVGESQPLVRFLS